MDKNTRSLLIVTLMLFVVGCSDPYKLSDKAQLAHIAITSVSPSSIRFGEPQVEETNIILPLLEGEYQFPANLTFSLSTGGADQKLLNIDPSQPVRFNSIGDIVYFYISSESGLPTKYQIMIAKMPGSDDNNVEYFSVGNAVKPTEARLVDPGIIESDSSRGIVRVKVDNGLFPLSFTPTIRISNNASCSISEGTELTFSGMADTIRFSVTSQSGKEKPWKVFLEYNQPQLPNHSLTQWSDNYSPTGWATANNFMVKGTTMFEDPQKGTVAKLTTSKVNLVKQIAAGSLFLGRFQLDLSALNNPPLMTFQGIPFTGRPVRLNVDLKYTPGEKLEKTENGQFVPMEGVDEGRVIFELLRYDGSPNDFDYHGFDNTPGVTRIARKVTNVGSTDGQWIRLTVDIEFLDTETAPNYISVMFSSGARGDYFIGAEGSTLLVSNIELVYSIP